MMDLNFSKDDLKVLSIASKQLGIALERIEKNYELKLAYEKVLQFSKTDFLTGLYNRYELIKRLKK